MRVNGSAILVLTSWLLIATRGSVSSKVQSQRCTKVPKELEMCRSLGFEKMALPNMNDDKNSYEVKHSLEAWQSVWSNVSSCHPLLRHFLCAVHTPVCSTHSGTEELLMPCRGLCDVVETSCKPLFAALAITWPHALRCSRFPRQQPCVQPDSLALPLTLSSNSESLFLLLLSCSFSFLFNFKK